MVIGHEVTHAFDDYGSQYDKNGDRVPWWSNNTLLQFQNRTRCIANQYSNYTVAQIGENVRLSFVSRHVTDPATLLVEWYSDTGREHC
jgi:predicted metalloendopeptidase